MVPVEEEAEDFPYDSVEQLLERAKGKYDSGMNKEGIVIRPVEPVYLFPNNRRTIVDEGVK